MKIIIGSRKSDLARLQAALVGEALCKADGSIEPVFYHKTAEGDRDRVTPLWQFADKGVFTRDLSLLLEDRTIDIAVHSWKDLPLQNELQTDVAATLSRADSCDVFFLRKEAWEACAEKGSLKVLSSSPRRSHNLEPFLRKALPASFHIIEFEPVRGNVPTRARKLLEGEGDALVIAKAALDRVLAADNAEYAPAREAVLHLLESCWWMITPLSQNPPAAAQGALGIEASLNRPEISDILAKINCARTMSEVREERKILGDFGGGCHQKIGVSVTEKEYGKITVLKGITDDGKVLDERTLERKGEAPPHATADKIWPEEEDERMLFTRREIQATSAHPAFEECAFFVSRTDALPSSWRLPFDTIVWAAGVETWQKLAKRGIWVNGCADGLGEDEPRRLEYFVPGRKWYKLSHSGAPADGDLPLIPTYDLVPQDNIKDLSSRTHFFWRSSSQFEEALRRYPSILSGWHSSGPGNTHRRMREILPDSSKLSIFLSYRDWKKTVLG